VSYGDCSEAQEEESGKIVEPFIKFPHTPHLLWLGKDPPRADKILQDGEVEDFLAGRVLVEEKVDGANIGFSVDSEGNLRVQNRGNYLDRRSHDQFKPLWSWMSQHRHNLIEALSAGLILFGEWCYAMHSVYYDQLPDWFLAFDVYDKRERIFWSCKLRNELVDSLGLAMVPLLDEGKFSRSDLLGFFGSSSLGSEPMEGIYLRKETDVETFARAKIVRSEFTQGIDRHWSGKILQKNSLAAHHGWKLVL